MHMMYYAVSKDGNWVTRDVVYLCGVSADSVIKKWNDIGSSKGWKYTIKSVYYVSHTDKISGEDIRIISDIHNA